MSCISIYYAIAMYVPEANLPSDATYMPDMPITSYAIMRQICW